VLPGGRFQGGGTAAAPGQYDLEAGETVRTPGQEALLQTLLGASGLPIAQSVQPQAQPIPNATPGQAQAGPLPNATPGMGQVLPVGGGGVASAGVVPQLPQMVGPPQFGDPNAFPRIPGIAESAITPQQAEGPGLPQPIQQQPMPGSFLSPGARTAWTVRDVLNNISQSAQNYQKMQWNKRMMTAQSMAMEKIQEGMQKHPVTAGAQPAPGQAQAAEQQPDPVQQAIQAALATTTDPKERQRLEKMLQQNQRAQQRKASEWAKIMKNAQDPTSPEYIGVQRAYGLARASGEQALNDEYMKARAQAAWLNSQAQYAEALAKWRTAQQAGQIGQQLSTEHALITGEQPAGAAKAPADTTQGMAAKYPESPVAQLIDKYGSLSGGNKALLLAGWEEATTTGKMKPYYDAVKEVWKDNEKQLKVSSKLSEVVYDPTSPTKYVMWARNEEGHDIIDPKTNQQMVVPVPAPARAEMAQITHQKFTDTSGRTYLIPVTNYRNIPVDPNTGRASAPTSGATARNALGGTTASRPSPTTTFSASQLGIGQGMFQQGGRPTQAFQSGAYGGILLGQSKIPKMATGALAGGQNVAGTPDELAAAGVPQGAQKALDANIEVQVYQARNLISKGGLLDAVDEDLKRFAPGELNSLFARWQDFLSYTVGELPRDKNGNPDDRYVRLHTDLNGFLDTAVMQAHVGSRGSERMMEHFQTVADAGYMNAEVIKGAMQEERAYLREKAMNPMIDYRVPGKPGVFHIPVDQLLGFHEFYKGKEERVY
jgi:hypothetical protein